MAVSKTNKSAAPEQEQDQIHLELSRTGRYLYRGTLYTRGAVYVFTQEGAKHVLALRDPQGLPVFIRAKPRTKLVEIPVEVKAVSIKSVGAVDAETLTPSQYVAPVGKLDLGDDDPEIIAKLAAADASPELIDTAVSVSV